MGDEGGSGRPLHLPSQFCREPKVLLKIKTTEKYSEKVLHFCDYKILLLILFVCHSPPGAKGGRILQGHAETLA